MKNIFQGKGDTAASSHVHRNVDGRSRLDEPKELGLPEGAELRSLPLESESLIGQFGALSLEQADAASLR